MNLMTGRDGTKGSNLETAAVKPRRIAFTVDGDDGSNNAASRTISWRFELLSDSDGKQASWEEHMIRLLWSSDSCGVSHVTLLSSKAICPPPSSWEPNMMRTIRKDSVVEFTWESVSRQEFRLVAYSVPSPVFRQYDLWIDGVSFFDLEERHTIPQLRQSFDESKLQELQIKEPTPSLSADTLPHNTPISNNVDRHIVKKQLRYDDEDKVDETDSIIVHHADPADENRHPMLLGLSPSETRSHIESRAIDMAFKDDVDIPWSSPSKDGCSIEANALCDAYDLMRGNALTKETISANSVDRVTFVHDQLTQMVNNVRVGAMSPEAAARTIHSIQMITGLAEFPAIWEVTVVFFGLQDTTTSSELWDVMEQYGEIESAAVADVGRGFGFCSFRSSSSAWYSIQACRNREVLLKGEPLCAMRIQNGNWLDPILLSPSTPKRENLSMKSLESAKAQSVPELTSSVTSSPIPQAQKISSVSSPPRNTPIRFLKRLFKSPKQSQPESTDDDAGAPAIPMLDHEENEKHYHNRDIFLPMEDDTLDRPCNGCIIPPMIRRRHDPFDFFESNSLAESPMKGQVKVTMQKKVSVITRTHSNYFVEDQKVHSRNDTADTADTAQSSLFTPDATNKADFIIAEEMSSGYNGPMINNENMPLPSDTKSPRGVFFGLSPLKPRGLFHRRQRASSISSEISVTHLPDDVRPNEINTLMR